MWNSDCFPRGKRAALPSLGTTQCFCFFLCAVFLCFRNPANSDMDCRIFNVRTFLRVCIHTGVWGTPTTIQHKILTRKNSHRFVLCSGRDSNLWSWNPLHHEADALPNEPPHPLCIGCCINLVGEIRLGWQEPQRGRCTLSLFHRDVLCSIQICTLFHTASLVCTV